VRGSMLELWRWTRAQEERAGPSEEAWTMAKSLSSGDDDRHMGLGAAAAAWREYCLQQLQHRIETGWAIAFFPVSLRRRFSQFRNREK
jgi:hypothetical protein